jgi:hypothetical protein
MSRTVFAAILLVATAALAADEAAPPTRHFIERIDVRNAHRVSREVIVSESRLDEGKEYTEADLRSAVNRLSRLPFLLSAEFSLEKGSERGRHVLVINVAETKPLFFEIDVRPLRQEHGAPPDYSDRIGVGPNHGTVGARHFVGRRGAFHLAVSSSDLDEELFENHTTVDVGYTQYGLFGSSGFATLNLRRALGSRAAHPISPELVVGFPVSLDQTVVVQFADTALASTARHGIGLEGGTFLQQRIDTEEKQRHASVTWSYDTTNHPFLPTSGSVLSVTPFMAWGDTRSKTTVVAGPPAPIVRAGFRSRTEGITIDAARHWELSERYAVSGRAQLGHTAVDLRGDVSPTFEDSSARRATIEVGLARNLFPTWATEKGESRVDLTLRSGVQSGDLQRSIHFSGRSREDSFRQLAASWVRRSPWGTLRLGAGYEW